MRVGWLIALVFACNDETSELTGIDLTVRYDVSLALEQIAVAGELEDGTEAFAPGRLPDPPRPLTEGENNLVLLLPETLSGRAVQLTVQGMSKGSVAAEGRVAVQIVSKEMRRASVDLAEIAVEGCDAGTCPEDADAAFEDAEADAADGAEDALDADAAEPDPDDTGTPELDADVPDVEVDTGVEEDIGPIDMGEPDTGCLPQAPVIGDGIDQDCDGFDECYEDLDGDDFGSGAVVSDDDLSCTNASRPTAIVATDCDDGAPLIFPGAPCNDGSATSQNDLCFGPACRGYETAGCGANCDGCVPGGCCARNCPGGTCGACLSNCSCNFDCNNSMSCTTTCDPGAVCHLFVNRGNNATLTCEDGASCDLACNSTSQCLLECIGSAFCIISSCNSSTCTLGCTAPMSCPAGEQVCNRQCP